MSSTEPARSVWLLSVLNPSFFPIHSVHSTKQKAEDAFKHVMRQQLIDDAKREGGIEYASDIVDISTMSIKADTSDALLLEEWLDLTRGDSAHCIEEFQIDAMPNADIVEN